jgi:hypothetical protein
MQHKFSYCCESSESVRNIHITFVSEVSGRCKSAVSILVDTKML